MVACDHGNRPSQMWIRTERLRQKEVLVERPGWFYNVKTTTTPPPTTTTYTYVYMVDRGLRVEIHCIFLAPEESAKTASWCNAGAHF